MLPVAVLPVQRPQAREGSRQPGQASSPRQDMSTELPHPASLLVDSSAEQACSVASKE